jgi:hypothetical protein
MTDQRCLTSAIARRSALTAGPSSSSSVHVTMATKHDKMTFVADATLLTLLDEKKKKTLHNELRLTNQEIRTIAYVYAIF